MSKDIRAAHRRKLSENLRLVHQSHAATIRDVSEAVTDAYYAQHPTQKLPLWAPLRQALWLLAVAAVCFALCWAVTSWLPGQWPSLVGFSLVGYVLLLPAVVCLALALLGVYCAAQHAYWRVVLPHLAVARAIPLLRNTLTYLDIVGQQLVIVRGPFTGGRLAGGRLLASWAGRWNVLPVHMPDGTTQWLRVSRLLPSTLAYPLPCGAATCVLVGVLDGKEHHSVSYAPVPQRDALAA